MLSSRKNSSRERWFQLKAVNKLIRNIFKLIFHPNFKANSFTLPRDVCLVIIGFENGGSRLGATSLTTSIIKLGEMLQCQLVTRIV